MAQKGKSKELAELIEFQIRSGEYQKGDQLDSIRNLAQQHVTTVGTVSKSMDILEEHGLIERIAGKGVFVKNQREVKVAIVLDNIFSAPATAFSLLPVLLAEIDRQVTARNWQSELFVNVNDAQSARPFLDRLNSGGFDVVFVGSKYVARAQEDIFSELTVLPIGLFCYKELDFSIAVDAYSMVYDAVLELTRRGCEEIALFDVDDPRDWSAAPKIVTKGFYDAMKRVGKLKSNVHYYNLPISQAGGHEGFCRFFQECGPVRPVGVICTDSILTLGVLQAALLHRLDLPGDLVIASHANAGCGAGEFTAPMLVYRYHVDWHIQNLFKLLDDYLKGMPLPFGMNILEPTKTVTGSGLSL